MGVIENILPSVIFILVAIISVDLLSIMKRKLMRLKIK